MEPGLCHHSHGYRLFVIHSLIPACQSYTSAKTGQEVFKKVWLLIIFPLMNIQ